MKTIQSLEHLCGIALLILATAGGAWADPVIHGAGSTAAAKIYQSWAEEFQKDTGIALNYEAIGSSAGIQKIVANTADFGASDVAPPAVELERQHLVLLPMAITGVAPVVNLPHVEDGQLHLNGELLAGIFSGTITRWNAPALVQLNPRLRLPDLAITVVVRGDGSGTTYNFTDYLSKVSSAWKLNQGSQTRPNWPEGFTAVKGSEGVVQAVKDTRGAIGYVDYGYVKDNHLTSAALRNSAGEYLLPAINAFKAALASSVWTSQGNFQSTLTDQPGKAAWPITMGTFALVHQTSDRPEQTRLALRFFLWAYTNGDRLVQRSNFVRLPDRVQALAFKALSSVKGSNGDPIGLRLMGNAVESPQ